MRRKIINISLPQELDNEVNKVMKSGIFASKSEFFRHLIREWNENKLFKELEESRGEIASGKGKVLRSLKDLR